MACKTVDPMNEQPEQTITRALLVLANFHFGFGLIGIDEYAERVEVARWLGSKGPTADPRTGIESDEGHCGGESEVPGDEVSHNSAVTSNDDQPIDSIEFIFRKEWVFTKSDPDPYPSTPHGHLGNQNRRWPKLNPYTGRVFKAKHQEDESARLRKSDLVDLWRNERFRDFCRSHIIWYAERHPHHVFPVAHPFRFPKW